MQNFHLLDDDILVAWFLFPNTLRSYFYIKSLVNMITFDWNCIFSMKLTTFFFLWHSVEHNMKIVLYFFAELDHQNILHYFFISFLRRNIILFVIFIRKCSTWFWRILWFFFMVHLMVWGGVILWSIPIFFFKGKLSGVTLFDELKRK